MNITIRNSTGLFISGALVFLTGLLSAILLNNVFFALIPFSFLLFLFGWRSLQIPFFLLIICIPVSMEYQVTDSLGTDLPDELLMVLVSTLFLLYWIYRPSILPAKYLKHPLIVVLLLILTWTFITSLFSTDPLLSVKYIAAKTWYVGAFVGAALVLFQQKKFIRLTAILLTSSMVAITFVIIVRHAAWNFTFSHINDALRPFFRNHVNYSALLVCVCAILFGFITNNGSRLQRNWLSVVMLVLLISIFFSYARGAWLALLVGAICWWLIKKKALVSAFLVAILLLVSAALWLGNNNRYLEYAHDYKTTIFHENFEEHMVATYKMKDVSTAERFYRWIAGVRMVEEKPVVGFGPNTFYLNYRPYTVPAFKTWVSNNPEHSTVHNYFLLLLAEQGIPGLLLFLILCLLITVYVQKIYHRTSDLVYKRTAIITGTVFMMILTVNLLSDLIETDKIGSLFFLCLSVLVVADLQTRHDNKEV